MLLCKLVNAYGDGAHHLHGNVCDSLGCVGGGGNARRSDLLRIRSLPHWDVHGNGADQAHLSCAYACARAKPHHDDACGHGLP